MTSFVIMILLIYNFRCVKISRVNIPKFTTNFLYCLTKNLPLNKPDKRGSLKLSNIQNNFFITMILKMSEPRSLPLMNMVFHSKSNLKISEPRNLPLMNTVFLLKSNLKMSEPKNLPLMNMVFLLKSNLKMSEPKNLPFKPKLTLKRN